MYSISDIFWIISLKGRFYSSYQWYKYTHTNTPISWKWWKKTHLWHHGHTLSHTYTHTHTTILKRSSALKMSTTPIAPSCPPSQTFSSPSRPWAICWKQPLGRCSSVYGKRSAPDERGSLERSPPGAPEKTREMKYSCLNLETASRDVKMHVFVEMGHIDQVNCGGISAVLACFTG